MSYICQFTPLSGQAGYNAQYVHISLITKKTIQYKELFLT